jgi:glycosyltransferase involved in cell wall biosynthesis
MISLLTPTITARKVFWPWAISQVQLIRPGNQHVEWLVAVNDRDAFAEYFDRHYPYSAVHLRILECRGMSLGRKRQALLDAAEGETVAWLDDDDWHHPDWLIAAQKILHGLPTGFGMAYCGALYVELETGRGVDLVTHRNQAMPISFVGSTALARESKFPDWLSGEDVRWFDRLPRERMFWAYQDGAWQWAALAHPLSYTAGAKRDWRYDLASSLVDRMLGPEWVDTLLARGRLAEQVRAQVARV